MTPMAGSNAQRRYEPQWTPLAEAELFANLQAGEEFHLGSIQSALSDEAEILVSQKLQTLFLGDFSRDPGLKRLTTCATTAGGNAVTRTVEALQGLSNWSGEKTKQVLESSGIVFLLAGDTKGEKCFGCGKKIKPSLLISPRFENSRTRKEDWHVSCWVADQLRDATQEIRSSKGAIDKQARSARAILQANEKFMETKKHRSNTYMIRDRMQFDHWIQGLYLEWIKTTKVKSDYHVTYLNYFKEYADQILEYMASNRIPTRQVVIRLAKHLDEEIAESVVKKMLRIPIKTLRYFGLVDNDTEPLGSVSEYIEEKPNSKEEDPELAWANDALCASTDPEAFFPEKGGSTREAKRICAMCSVRAECLEYALNHGENKGIWGGTTAEERKEMARTHQSNCEKEIIREIPVRQSEARSGAIFKMDFLQYSDCRTIAEKYRDGYSILLDLNQATDSDRLRAVDFLTGMIFAQNGSIEKVSNNIFLLLTSSTRVIGDVKNANFAEDPYEHLRSQLLA